jgi:REP element-mobilizing transposase RayT
MVIASHVIFGTYGFWLPNDPRGSWSDWVYSWDLFRYGGPATKVNDRRSHASDPHNINARQNRKQHLKYPPVILDGYQALSIVKGFASISRRSGYQIYACAILPEHIHLVIGRHDYHVEQIVRRLKQEAGLQLKKDNLHPFADLIGKRGAVPSVFGGGLWKCFIDSPEHLDNAIAYVQKNPLKEGKKLQQWSFVSSPLLAV